MVASLKIIKKLNQKILRIMQRITSLENFYNFRNKFSYNFEPQATPEIIPSYFLTATKEWNANECEPSLRGMDDKYTDTGIEGVGSTKGGLMGVEFMWK